MFLVFERFRELHPATTDTCKRFTAPVAFSILSIGISPPWESTAKQEVSPWIALTMVLSGAEARSHRFTVSLDGL